MKIGKFHFGKQSTVKDNYIRIIDIGCRWGFAERFEKAEFKNKLKIYGFDPDKEECARLQEKYQDFSSGLVKCIPLALAGSQGWRNLYITKEPACSSLHPPIQRLSDNYPALECTQIEKIVSVYTDTLENWAKKEGIKTLDYIKLDTQGSELEILKGAGALLSTCRCIDIEVEFNPIYEGQSLFGETDSFLRQMGFVLWRISNSVYYSIGGEKIKLSDINTMHFDENVRQESDAYAGQLFWADAKYIHNSIVNGYTDEAIKTRDKILFESLEMHDIINHINYIEKMNL